MQYIIKNLIANLKSEILGSIKKSIDTGSLKAVSSEEISDIYEKIKIEIPANKNHGEFSTNIAMSSAKIFRMSPRKIAEIVVSNFVADAFCGGFVEKFEVAGAGFINFFMSKKFFVAILEEIGALKADYGKCNYGKNKKILIEYVSANPTGPMHIGNARLGVLGDCLAAALKKVGYSVYKEFYVNDTGNQIEKFGESLDARYKRILSGEDSETLPEGYYQGNDIKELAAEFYGKYAGKYEKSDGDVRKKKLIEFALPKNIERMKTDIKKYKIKFDNWFYESTLYDSSEVDKVLKMLAEKGLTYNKGGALWYKATDFGCEKDEVLVRSSGIHTYFASDIAYHYNKFRQRGFDICINIWGADHHGHIARLKSAVEALGIESKNLIVVLVQLVKLIKNGQPVRMGKRTGKTIQLTDLLDEVSVDSARFIFNTKEANTKMDFDLDMAVRQDFQNPVYYVQYAHARICSILSSSKEKSTQNNSLPDDLSPEERDLIYNLGLFPQELEKTARELDPTIITRYVIETASNFHRFYNSHRVICDDPLVKGARLNLCKCVKTVISNVLNMFSISSPEVM
jgi:arginyl-tRNA synthetase